jgi:hypothetical protein
MNGSGHCARFIWEKMRMLKVTLLGFAALLFEAGGASAGMMGPGGMMGGGVQPPVGGDAKASASAVASEYCAACHALPQPTLHSADEWPLVLRRMEGYMQAQGRRLPSREDERKILAYLDREPDGGR